MPDFSVFKKVFRPVYIVYYKELNSYSGRTVIRQVQSFVIEEPCNPILSFFGLLRFDKNVKNFSSLTVIANTEEEFKYLCNKYSNIEKSPW